MGDVMNVFTKYLLLFCFFYLNNILSQTPQVISISPSFNEIANNNHPEISATFNVSMDSSSFDEISFAVFAERSGYHSGKIIYADEIRTVTFNSNEQFNAGERVNVMLSNKIKSKQGDSLSGFSWVFRIPSGVAPVNFYEAVEYDGGGWSMQCVDMNNDGFPDIVTSSGVILLNDGNGIFDNYWYIPDTDPFLHIIADDFNRDGYMDVFYYSNYGMKIGLGDGNGNFTFTTKPYWFYYFVAADFNGDGYPDIAGITDATYIPPDSTTLNWCVVLNDGMGNFNDTVMYHIGGGGRPEYIIATDLNNDGDLDIIIASHPVVNPSGVFGLNGFIVGKNDGNGIFNEFQLYHEDIYLRVFFPYYIYSSDYDKDGFNDLAIISSGGGLVAINSGDGTFGYNETDVRYFWPSELSAPISGGDIDGDGWIDIVVSGYEWPPEWQIPYYAVNINDNSYFPGFWNNNFNDTLPTGYILATEIVDLNNDTRQDIIHCGEGVYLTFSKDTVSSVATDNYEPNNFYLFQNYPNPFNGKTIINFETNVNEIIRISVYNILGEEVRLLENRIFPKGKHEIVWDAKNEVGMDLPSGVYIIKASSFKQNKLIKTVLLK
jgi:hypothetical protein